jgi:hypothetical protein
MRSFGRIGTMSIGITVALIASLSLAAPSAPGKVCGSALAADSADAAFVDTVPATPAVAAIPEPFPGVRSTVTSQQSSNTDQAKPNAGPEAKPVPGEDKNPSFKVNPMTGLVSTTASDYQPLTGEERWKLYWKMNFFSVGAYFGPFFDALLLDQATNSPAQWGGGFSGYGLRVASRTANAMLQGTIQAPVAAVLHEDVRYITSTQHGFKSRAVHALAYSFLTYDEHGHPTLNIANLGAYYGSTAISTLWLPGRYNVASYTFSNATEQIGLTLPVNLLQEFWPEVRRYVFRRH